jgi:glycosyltransferase involved in cell wall biosynthesis
MSAPVPVLHVVTRMNVGGLARHLQALIPALRSRGFAPVLMTGRVDEDEAELPLGDEETPVLRNPWLRRRIDPVADLRASNEIRRAIAWIRPAIVHTHMAKAGALGRRAAMTSGVEAIVHTFHGHVLEGYFATPVNRLFVSIERELARRTDALIGVSTSVRDDLLEDGIGELSRWRVIPYGFDLSSFLHPASDRETVRRELGIAEDAEVTGIVGRLVPIKNHGLFFRAARVLAASHPRAVFVVAGDGELRPALESEAREALGDRVVFTGWAKDLPSLYGSLDVVALTSLNEGTPVALMEAAGAGVASVATDVGGVRDVVVDGVTGLLVASEDAGSLAAAMARLLDDPASRRSIGERAREDALARFTVDAMGDAYADLYRQVLARTRLD